jgi:hypothetical protein
MTTKLQSLTTLWQEFNLTGKMDNCIPVSKAVLRIRDVLSRIRIRPLLHPGSRIRILDPGGKKAPDPDPQH